MGLKLIDLIGDALHLDLVAGLPRFIEGTEQAAEFAGIGLTQEGVELFDQRRHRRFLMHRLVGERSKLGPQSGNHPTRKIQITPVGVAEVLLDGNELLLADEAMPTPKRLGVLAGIPVVVRHVLAHNCSGVTGNIQARFKPVLQAHSRCVFRTDVGPVARLPATGFHGLDGLCICGHDVSPAVARH